MAKSTFDNLHADKKSAIYNALLQEFETNLLSASSVSNIVNLAKIPRGSFYQYFEDLEDSYLTVMEVEIGRIHNIFFDLMEQEEGNYFSALRLYGDELVKELYNKDKYNLYKNIYSYWNGAIEKKWQVFLNIEANDANKKHSYVNFEGISGHPDTLRFINEFIQHLVENLFMENWPPEVFLEKYNRYMDLFEQGLLPQR